MISILVSQTSIEPSIYDNKFDFDIEGIISHTVKTVRKQCNPNETLTPFFGGI